MVNETKPLLLFLVRQGQGQGAGEAGRGLEACISTIYVQSEIHRFAIPSLYLASNPTCTLTYIVSKVPERIIIFMRVVELE